MKPSSVKFGVPFHLLLIGCRFDSYNVIRAQVVAWFIRLFLLLFVALYLLFPWKAHLVELLSLSLERCKFCNPTLVKYEFVVA